MFVSRFLSSLSSVTLNSSTSTQFWKLTSTSTSAPRWPTCESGFPSFHRFCCSSAHTLTCVYLRKLTRVLNYYVGHAEEPVLTERLYAALKALKYLFRFIVQSRVLYLRYLRRCHRDTRRFPYLPLGEVEIHYSAFWFQVLREQ